MSFVCLAVIMVIMAGMFFYLRQKMASYDAKLNLLSDTVRALAKLTASEETHEPAYTEVESEHESECDSETCDSSHLDESESSVEIELEHDQIDFELVEESLPKIIVSNDHVDVKHVVIESTLYEDLSVKELKEKVAEMNGPKLKTKKDLLEYLRNKV